MQLLDLEGVSRKPQGQRRRIVLQEGKYALVSASLLERGDPGDPLFISGF
jgi:hypothetical protein